MNRVTCDICVIGAGSGGLSVAAGAVRMGASVVLIEAGEMGGDCLNFGCVPSKALLHAGAAGMDFAAAMEHVRATIAAIEPHDSQERFEGLGCTVIRARAAFTDPKTVRAGETEVRARRFVIATGSGPAVPPIPGLDVVPYLTNETLWSLTQAPGHLIVLGGGPIGVEMALAHRRLGSDVTVVEMASILLRDDPEAVEVVRMRLLDEGITLAENHKVEKVYGEAGRIVVEAGGRRFEGTHLLVATGRRPSVDGLGLDAAGIDHTPRGITVDAGLRTSNRRVYAIGDVTGGAQFTHVAGYQAGVVVRSALFGMPAKARADHVPWVTYTDPELAQVGLTEAEARERHGDAVEVVRFDLAGIDRAVASGQGTGFIKVMVRGGRPVGATIVGANAGEHIAVWALALSKRLKMSDIAGMIAPYPTMADMHKRVAGAYFSPRLFENAKIKHIVRLVQRFLP